MVNAVAGQTVSWCRAGEQKRVGVGSEWHAGRSEQCFGAWNSYQMYLYIYKHKKQQMIWNDSTASLLQITLWIACTHATELECKLQNQTSVMDHLTSFDGSVSWGHVRLLIFHNSPVKTHAHHTHLSFFFTENTQTKHISDTFQTPPRAIWLRG